MSARRPVRQRGAVLVVSMIMLLLITLMLVTALNLGTTNFRATSNLQFRSEALAAANKAIEQVMSTPFTAAPAAEDIEVDLEKLRAFLREQLPPHMQPRRIELCDDPPRSPTGKILREPLAARLRS